MGALSGERARPRAAADLTENGRGTTVGPAAPGLGPLLREVREQLEAPGWRGFALLRRYRSENPGSARTLARQLRSVRWEERDDFPARRVRFAFAGTGSTANLEDALLLEALDRGIIPISYHAASRQPSRELRDPASGLHGHQPEVVVIAATPSAPGAGTDPPGSIGAGEAEAFLDSLIEDLRAFRARSSAVLVIHNFPPPELRPLGLGDWREPNGQGEVYARLNLALAARCREIPDVQVVDVPHLVALSGAGWWTLHRSWFLGNLGASEELAPLLCREYAAVGAALRGLVRKCLVLDLDGTLWGGVVGEVGAEAVQIGRDFPGNIFRAIQRVVQQLHERGVVLALNSQNNEEDAWAPFGGRAEMLLERRHFAAWRINWKDKASNLRELSEELRLGLDSFVLLDNDPVQRAWVEDSLPEVHVIPAQDPLDMLRALTTQRLFDSLGQTAEDALRGKSYVAASRRREEQATATDRESFLASLGITVSVGRASPEHVPRLAQLSQRTNQFNLTTKRYTEGQMQELCAAPDAEVLYCACRDRFADEGVTGLVILRRVGAEWVVDTFLLSCRVLGWGVERALAAAMCRIAGARGGGSLRGEYTRTAKNGITEGFYRELGFSPLQFDSERSSWLLELPAPVDTPPAWIRLQVDGEAR